MTAELFIHPLTSNPIDPELLQVRVQELTTGLLEASDIRVPVLIERTSEANDEGGELGVFIDGAWIATVEYGKRERVRIDQREVKERERFGEPHGYPPEMVGAPYPYLRKEFKATISDEHFEAMNFIGHLYTSPQASTRQPTLLLGLWRRGLLSRWMAGSPALTTLSTSIGMARPLPSYLLGGGRRGSLGLVKRFLLIRAAPNTRSLKSFRFLAGSHHQW